MDILRLAHEADAIIAEAPIYYNCMAAQMMNVINRLCCTFACKTCVFLIPPVMTVLTIWSGQKKSPVGQPENKKCRGFCGCRRFSI